jgi:tryptophan synthase alpha subunit
VGSAFINIIQHSGLTMLKELQMKAKALKNATKIKD